MNRGQIIRLGAIVGVTLAILLVVSGWFYRSHRRDSAMAQAQARLTHPQPGQRLQAAEIILRYWPSDEPALLAQSQALNELGRYLPARRSLDRLTKHSETSVRLPAWQHLADSCLGQAHEAMSDAQATNYDLVATQVEPLLLETDGIVKALAVEATAQADRAVIEARLLDARMELASIRLRSFDLQWNKARAVQETQEVHAVAAQAGQWQKQHQDIQKQLESHCQRSLVRYPQDGRLRYQLFRLRLAQNDWPAARKIAGEIGTLANVPWSIRLAVADELLNMPDWHDQPLDSWDVTLAAKLLTSLEESKPQGLASLPDVQLALAQKQYDSALSQVHAILAIAEGHPRAMCLKAQALIGLGRADEAVRLLVPLNDRVRQVLVRQTLGRAYVAAGQVRQGRELWRQAIDMNPQRLSARLLLAQSLADDAMVLSGESDILQAYRDHPNHPQVLALYVRLLAEKNDAVKLLPLLNQRTQSFQADEAQVAAAMTLDEVAFVSAWAQKRLAGDPADPLACLSQVWGRMSPLTRPAMAMIVNQWALSLLQAHPLEQVQAPPIPVTSYRLIAPIDKETAAGRLVNPQVLEQGYFLPWPIQSTIGLLDLATARWPQETGLARQKEQLQAMFRPAAFGAGPWDDLLSLLKDQPDGYWLKVRKILLDRWQRSPWDESAALQVIRQRLAQGDWSCSQEVVQWARQANRPLGMLLSARLNLAIGRHLDALHDAELLAQETADSQWRWLVGEVRGHVYLINGQPDVAEAGFENLALSMPHHLWTMRIAAVDVLLAAGRQPGAAAQISTLLADPRLPARETDMLLARSRLVMSHLRQVKMLQGLLRYKPDDSLLLLYQAQAMAESGDAVGAGLLLDQLQRKHPASLRVWRLAGQMAMISGQVDQAMQAYQKLLQASGEAAKVARDDLERIGSMTSPSAQGAANP